MAIQTEGLNVSDMFSKMMQGVEKRGQDLKEYMASIDSKDMSNEKMLEIQFAVGQYNALIESLSTVTKSLVDEIKNLAQRSS